MRAAVRSVIRRPGFAIVAILTLALGIGGNAAIFSVIDAVLLRPLPYPEADRLMMVWEFSAEIQQRFGLDRLPSSPADYTDFRTRNRSFSSLASMRADRVNLTGAGDPVRVGAVRVGLDFFTVLRVQPIIGRAFLPDDANGQRAVLIGHGLWQSRFGGDPVVAGRAISLNGEPAQVLGVLPPWFRFPAAGELPETLGFSADPEIWTLDTFSPEQQRMRGGKSLTIIGRLRDGVSGPQAEADLRPIADEIAAQFPSYNAGWTVKVIPLREHLVAAVRPALMILWTAVGFVLLIACANVANLLLVRAALRQRDVCIRHALGAGRGRLFRQLLAESVVLAVIGGAAGLALAWWGVQVLLALVPSGLPPATPAGVDWRVAAYTLTISILTGLVFGLAPASQATRCDMNEGLRDGGRGAVGSRRAHRTRDALVVVEVALAVVLLIGAVLLVQTFVRLTRVDAGFTPERVLTMEIALPRTSYPDSIAAAFFDRLIARLSALPGVESAGVTSGLPLTGSENLHQVTIEGWPRPAPGSEILSDYRAVTPGYFESLGIARLSGSPLPQSPPAGESHVVVINETMAQRYWPGEDPIGRRVKLTSYDQPAPWLTVAAVVADTRHTALDGVLRPQVYVHQQQDPSQQMFVVLRTSSEPLSLAPAARQAVFELDPNQPVARIRTMTDVVAASVSDRRFNMFLLGLFAALAVTLSLIGLYAVVSYSVAERIREMGVRLALGAQPSNLVALVLGEGLRLAAAGVVLGLVAALVVTRFLEALLFGVNARDPYTFIGVPLLLLSAALLGCLIPARRAMRVDPMIALRAE